MEVAMDHSVAIASHVVEYLARREQYTVCPLETPTPRGVGMLIRSLVSLAILSAIAIAIGTTAT
jgi:hypothetical protein